MADQLLYRDPAGSTSKTIYAVVRGTDGRAWNAGTAALESFTAANWASYAISLPSQGAGWYGASVPALPAGGYGVSAYVQASTLPAAADALAGGPSDLSWDGAREVTTQTVNALVAVFDSGTVSASPAPATTSFAATGATLLGPSGFYTTPTPMAVVFTTGVLSGRSNRVTAHTVSGSTHTFQFVAPWPLAPASGDAFFLVG